MASDRAIKALATAVTEDAARRAACDSAIDIAADAAYAAAGACDEVSLLFVGPDIDTGRGY